MGSSHKNYKENNPVVVSRAVGTLREGKTGRALQGIDTAKSRLI